MNLIIESSVDIIDFCKWLITQIQSYMKSNLNIKRADIFDKYINENIPMQPKRILITKDLILSASYNLIVNKVQNNYIIEIDPNIFIPNTFAKFINIMQLINYGNLVLPPYPIWTETFNYFADNINKYLDIYLKEIS